MFAADFQNSGCPDWATNSFNMKLDQLLWVPLLNACASFALPEQSSLRSVGDFQETCTSIAPKLQIANATIYFSQFVAAGTNLSIPDYNVTCGQFSQAISTDICRIALYVATSNRSGINMEAWLPANWTGRFLSTGNGGISGCTGYNDMVYTTRLGFASVGANNGHNGTSGGAFYNNPEVVADFAYRSVHTGVVVGKAISKAFYGKAHKKSYYLGCSTGGRQGFKSAQDFPEDFDGIVAGAPAFAFNNLTSWSGHFYILEGNPTSPTFVPTNMWPIIHQDILKQCDAIDGYIDGIIEDPLLCNYDSKGLICGGNLTTNCLTPVQSQTVQKIFSPLYAADGSLVYPRMQPGSEISAAYISYTGAPFPYMADWYRYAIYNDPSWDPATLNTTDYANAARINPSNIETWKGDLSAVHNRGAKILHYHGQMDAIITSDNSPRYYEHVSKTMRLKPTQLDSFYRFFRISGMDHCYGGDGASVIGQSLNSVASLDPSQNVLMAIVNWVENGKAPETIIGTRFVNDTQSLGVQYQRAHCKYPKRNVYKGGDAKKLNSWECV
ncbi:tannase and feruloyl esterase [Lindgomyces ingoldianus]|uniref:Tannase and feruloyl esterase n=1 Tax=Lindgomyces ingoldianus TaxID=673940 RepID=A0ACB6QX52_9PLEO|nr:tannase and feruloyl esterase [Lindgomyces ingoldianus]KAF2470862.1 tannase and feruloyl esterase [Lindgomyces ingoldianus]